MTADGPSHQQPRTNKRKARSDVSLVLIRRVNLALGLMGGSQRSPLGPPSGSGLRVTQRGPGRAGWGRGLLPALPSCASHLLGHPPLPSPTVPGERPAPPLPGHSGVGGGRGGQPHPLQPPQLEDHAASWTETGLGWTLGTCSCTRAHASTRTHGPRIAQRGAHPGRAEAPALLPHIPSPGPRAPGPPADTGRTRLRRGQGGREGSLGGPAGPGRSAQGVLRPHQTTMDPKATGPQAGPEPTGSDFALLPSPCPARASCTAGHQTDIQRG